MTKRWFFLLALVLVGGMIVQSRRSDADEKNGPAPARKTAYLNLSYVLKNYQRSIDLTEEVKKEVAKYETQVAGKKATLEALNKDSRNPDLRPSERKELEAKITDVTRAIEDINKECKEFVRQKSEEMVVIIYREVQEVAQRYATARDFDAVLHFNDALASTPDYYSAPNVARKMQAGAIMPLYIRPELDITFQVVQTLNAGYKPKGR
jgi:Skp family chaperone for outer membrane proteins